MYKIERPAAKTLTSLAAGRYLDAMVNSMSSSNQTHKIIKSSCSLLIDPCAGTYLRPLPGSHFEFIGKFDEFRPESEGGNPRISLAEAARSRAVRERHPRRHD